MFGNFASFLQNEETKEIVINFLDKVIDVNFKDIIFCGIEEFQSIAEYDFYLINFIGITDKNIKKEFFIKKIKKGKIKESLFCICDLVYEKYFNNNPKKSIEEPKKITILEEKEKVQYISKVSVNLFKGSLNKKEVSIEINFIEGSYLIEQIQNQKNIMKGSREDIEINQKDILIIGIKNQT